MLRPLIRKSSLYLVLSSFTFAPLTLNAKEEKRAREKSEAIEVDSEYTIYSIVGAGIGMLIYSAGLFGYTVYTSMTDTRADTNSSGKGSDKKPDGKSSYTQIVSAGGSSNEVVGKPGNHLDETIQGKRSKPLEAQVFSSNTEKEEEIVSTEQKKEEKEVVLTDEQKIELAKTELDALVKKVNKLKGVGLQEFLEAKEELRKKMLEIRLLYFSQKGCPEGLETSYKRAESCFNSKRRR